MIWSLIWWVKPAHRNAIGHIAPKNEDDDDIEEKKVQDKQLSSTK